MFGDGVKAAWDQTRGEFFLKILQECQSIIGHKEHLLPDFIQHVADLYQEVDLILPTMTEKGRLKKAKDLQNKGASTIDTNIPLGYAYWVVGIWIEAKQRTGIAAQKAGTLAWSIISTSLQVQRQGATNMPWLGVGLEDNLQYYQTVCDELDSGTFDQALWLKARVMSNGDEEKSVIEYTKLRVAQLAEFDEQARLQDEKRRLQEEKEAMELAEAKAAEEQRLEAERLTVRYDNQIKEMLKLLPSALKVIDEASLKTFLNYANRKGIIVTGVSSDLEEIISTGDIIVSCNGVLVLEDIDYLRKYIKEHDEAELILLCKATTLTIKRVTGIKGIKFTQLVG